MRALVAASALLALHAFGPIARADSFEAKAQGAAHVKRLDDLVWPLVAACDHGDDTERRQCRLVRDASAARLAGKTFLVDGEPTSLVAHEWDPARKSSRITLAGCIRCTPIEVDGRKWYVIASKAGARVEGGVVVPAYLYDGAHLSADPDQAQRWARSMASPRVELVVKVAAKPRAVVDGRDVVALDVLAFRAIAPCDGSIIVADPASNPIAGDPKHCPRADEVPGNEPPVDVLSPAMIEDAMRPVYAAARTCAADHKLVGKVRLHVTVVSDGTVAKVEQQGDLATTPVAACIDKAAKAARFPHTTQGETSFNYPMSLP